MGQIFLFAGLVNVLNNQVEAALLQIRTLVATGLRSRGYTVLEVPQGFTLAAAIDWINRRATPQDVALAMQADAFATPTVRGTSTFYLAGNQQRRQQAQQILMAVIQSVPTLVSRDARPDNETIASGLAFVRQITAPAFVLNAGFITNASDRAIILNQTQAIAQGIVNGMAALDIVSPGAGAPSNYPSINVSVNGQLFGETGVIADQNSYVPVGVVARLNVNIARPTAVRLIHLGRTTYIRAVDLRPNDIFVGWDAPTRTVILRSLQGFDLSRIGEIARPNYLSAAELESFLRSRNPQALQQFPDITALYLEEGAVEGISSDVAFAQALLETGFFRFGAGLNPLLNNFGGLRTAGNTAELASFPSARIGVRAQIQHLKAYANVEPLALAVVDPRFQFVTRGIAPMVQGLSNRWSADPQYGDKILVILRQMYQAAGLL